MIQEWRTPLSFSIIPRLPPGAPSNLFFFLRGPKNSNGCGDETRQREGVCYSNFISNNKVTEKENKGKGLDNRDAPTWKEAKQKSTEPGDERKKPRGLGEDKKINEDNGLFLS
jgi:hypothetical protein